MSTWLGRLALVLAGLAVVGGVLAFRAHRDDGRDTAAQERYGAVQRAAGDEAVALLNIDYRNPQDTIDRVKAGATGDFRQQFDKATGGLVEVVTKARSVMTGKVIWTGVVTLDDDSATVIVATTGTVTNTQTGKETAARNFRIKVDLVKEKDRWLTSGLDFVSDVQ